MECPEGFAPVYHDRGSGACGALVLSARDKHWSPEDVVQPEDVRWADGHTAFQGEDVYCSGCGAALYPLADKDGRIHAQTIQWIYD